jgi:hypothetical protein
MVIYESAYDYIIKSSDELIKINRMTAIINAYSDSLLEGALNGNVSEYSLDDGQSKIRTVNRSPKDLADLIRVLELQRDRLIVRYNKLNVGSMIRLVDSKNQRNNYGY